MTPFNVNQAYRFEAGIFIPLGALPGAPAGTAFESVANSINSSGVIVGRSDASLGGGDSDCEITVRGAEAHRDLRPGTLPPR